jgi:hypothetical protein
MTQSVKEVVGRLVVVQDKEGPPTSMEIKVSSATSAA